MNLDDLLCVGATGPFLFTSVINRNKQLISADAIKAIIQGNQAFMDLMATHDIEVKYLGGETADLGDLVRTITVDGAMQARMPRANVIEASNIKAGNVIVGLASYGQATYETQYNSGIGSNGLTAARHDVLQHVYATKYPESFDPAIDKELVYAGKRSLTEPLEGTDLTIGKALLSPTRTYAPVIKSIIEQQLEGIDGIVHCTGGGQTKVLHFAENVHIVKTTYCLYLPFLN